jgi:hypothetical protein
MKPANSNGGGVNRRAREQLARFGLVYTVHLLTGERGVCTVPEFTVAQSRGKAIQGFTDPMWAEAHGQRIEREIQDFERGLS